MKVVFGMSQHHVSCLVWGNIHYNRYDYLNAECTEEEDTTSGLHRNVGPKLISFFYNKVCNFRNIATFLTLDIPVSQEFWGILNSP